MMVLKKQILNIAVLAVMLCASFLAHGLRPTDKIADDAEPVKLEVLFPKQFGAWTEVPQASGGIVNPQQQQVIERIYSQTLSRTYVDDQGNYIMLSVAYGENQSDANQLHLPDVCYPAQGFQIHKSEKSLLNTEFGTIPVKRLYTVLGNRTEPLTYWTTVGNTVAIGGFQTKIAQLRYGFQRKIPDGLILRVSSISRDLDDAYKTQDNFVKSLIANLTPEQRLRVAGIAAEQ